MDYLKFRVSIMIWMEFLLKQVNIKTFQNKILNNEISKIKSRFFYMFSLSEEPAVEDENSFEINKIEEIEKLLEEHTESSFNIGFGN